jgi:hypothetical protein
MSIRRMGARRVSDSWLSNSARMFCLELERYRKIAEQLVIPNEVRDLQFFSKFVNLSKASG